MCCFFFQPEFLLVFLGYLEHWIILKHRSEGKEDGKGWRQEQSEFLPNTYNCQSSNPSCPLRSPPCPEQQNHPSWHNEALHGRGLERWPTPTPTLWTDETAGKDGNKREREKPGRTDNSKESKQPRNEKNTVSRERQDGGKTFTQMKKSKKDLHPTTFTFRSKATNSSKITKHKERLFFLVFLQLTQTIWNYLNDKIISKLCTFFHCCVNKQIYFSTLFKCVGQLFPWPTSRC